MPMRLFDGWTVNRRTWRKCARLSVASLKHEKRAGDVVARIRDLIKKAPPRKDRLQINETMREVPDLTYGEAAKNGIALQTELADDLPHVQGDRVELQQVLLDLIINAVEALVGVSDVPREVLISSEKSQVDHVLVTVRGSGPGLALPASNGCSTPSSIRTSRRA